MKNVGRMWSRCQFSAHFMTSYSGQARPPDRTPDDASGPHLGRGVLMPGAKPRCDQLLRPVRYSVRFAAIFVRELSVDSQLIQASVTETPYFNCDKSSGMLWLPSLILDSIITPQIERLPSLIWCVMSSSTSGWTLWSLFELACEQSTTMLVGSPAFSKACSHRAILTES